MRAAVIGAGWAGLTAAWDLSRRGLSVTVLEQAPRVGGRTFSFHDSHSGEWLDNGQHVILGLCQGVQKLLEASHQPHAVRFQELLDVPVYSARGQSRLGSRRLAGSAHLAPALLTYPELSWSERIKILLVGRQLAGTPTPAGIRPTRDDSATDRSWAEWLASHGQSKRAVHAFWDAIGTGVLNARAAHVSARLASQAFSLLLQGGWRGARLGQFTVPLGMVAEQLAGEVLAQGAEIRCRWPVDQIRLGADGGVCGVQGSRGAIAADVVIAAIPPDRLAALLHASGLETQITLPGFRFSPILNTYLFYDRPVWDQDLALLLDDMAAMVFNRSHILETQNRRTTLAVSVSAAQELRQAPLNKTGEEVARLTTARLKLPAPVRVRSVWQPRATILIEPGKEQVRPPSETSVAGLYLAGDWIDTGWPACIEGAVQSGHLAAQAVVGETIP